MKQKYQIRKKSNHGINEIKKQIGQTLLRLEQAEGKVSPKVCLKTLKSMDETELIVKKLGMEVILAMDGSLNIKDLSKEEKMAFLDSIEKHIQRDIKALTYRRRVVNDHMIISRQYAKKSLDLIRRSKKNPN